MKTTVFIYCLALAVLLISLPATADNVSATIKTDPESRSVRLAVQNTGRECGILVTFGDGKRTYKTLGKRKTFETRHQYTQFGEFTVTVRGSGHNSGKKVTPACEIDVRTSFLVQAANYIVLASDSIIGSGVNLDGTHKWIVKKELPLGRAWSTCYIPSSAIPETDLNLTYDAAFHEFRTAIQSLGLSSELRFNGHDCDFRTMEEYEWENVVSFVPFIIVQPDLVPRIKELRHGSDPLFELTTIDYTSFREEADRRISANRLEAEQHKTALANRIDELQRLAAVNSREKVGSLSFGIPRKKGPVRFCTLSYEGAWAIAISEYGRLGLDNVSDSFRSAAAKVGATFDQDEPFAHVYDDIETLYRVWQQSRHHCRVYVDFPGNLKKFFDAVQRDSDVKVEVNEFISSSQLRDSWAKRGGFASYDQYVVQTQRMREMNVSEGQYRALTGFGITDKQSMDLAFGEMTGVGYADTDSVSVLIAFLGDKATAAGRLGETAASVRDARRAREAAARARAASTERSRSLPESDLSSVSGYVCQQHQHVLTQVIAGYRQAGVPLNSAQSVFDSESSVRLRRFLKALTAVLYSNPDTVVRNIQSDSFLKECIEIHRGF